MVLAHSFYCSNGECDNEVEHSGDMCLDCIDTVSDVSSHCCGCGEDLFANTNGYCGTCWTEKFGEDDSLTREPLSWYNGVSRYCTDCDEWYVFSLDDDDRQCPSCVMYGCVRCEDCGKKDSLPLCNGCAREREIEELRMRIASIDEKLKTGMTASQMADWAELQMKAYQKLLALTA